MRVVVIGAGIAGLTAAAHLIENGLTDVSVVEARSRYGGRVNTCAFGENVVEMGGNWLHGTALNNSMFVLACQNGLLSQANPPVNFQWNDRFCYLPDGTALDKTVCNQAYNLFSRIRDEMDGAQHDDSFPAGCALDSVQRYLAVRVNEELARSVPDASHRTRLKCVINAYFNLERMSTACDLSDASVKHYGSYGSIPGASRLYLPCGVANVLDCIARSVPAGCILYGTEVTRVAYDVSRRDGAVELTCRRRPRMSQEQEQQQQQQKQAQQQENQLRREGDGASELVRLVADCVIVTVPLGCLKASVDAGAGGLSGELQFDPVLPPAKAAAIRRLGYTGVEKLFVYYRTPFWQPGSGGPLLCWPDGSGGGGDRRPQQALTPDGDEWYTGMIGFSEYPYNRGVLFAWVPLPHGARLSALADADVKRDCARLFRQFLRNPSIPEPDAVARSRWCDDPYARGTYSYMSRRGEPADVLRLAEPIFAAAAPVATGGCREGGARAAAAVGSRPIVLFAGEATALPHYSTMHGARSSGFREAERIVAAVAAESLQAKL